MSATLHRELPLGMKLRDALAWIGTCAMEDGNGEAEVLCRKLIRKVGDTEVTVLTPAVHILCQAVGSMRESGEVEAAAEVEKIIAALKRGGKRHVLGTLNFHAMSPGQVHDKLETIAKLAGV